MAYKKIFLDDKIIFGVSDTEFIDISSYEKFEYFCSLSNNNLSSLIEDIKVGLREAVEEELSLLDNGSINHLTKTTAYVRLLQTVSSAIYIKNEALAKEEAEKLEREKLIKQAEEWQFNG
jgi:hypothetical protein